MAEEAKQLWENYAFLTKEMSKFLARKEYDLFFELMEQREQLQIMINESNDTDFKQSPQGQELLLMVRQENAFIIANLRMAMNQMQQHHTVSTAYEGKMPPAGRSFDHQG